MALNAKSTLVVPIQIGLVVGTDSNIAIYAGTTAPDGDSAPFSDMAKGSLYIFSGQTDDVSSLYLKVDDAGADDDWVQVMVHLSEGAFSLESLHPRSPPSPSTNRSTKAAELAFR